MLVFNEGVPRAGKSYDAVKSHILPALKKGRRVYARLNGLKHDLIAAHLKLTEERVRELLVHVESGDVPTMFVATQDPDTRAWGIPAALKDSLIVIDEIHEFYVAGRGALPPQQEQFFALIGQNGGDVVIMTQSIKRLHAAVRARIERKNVFQKLTVVGKKAQYRVTYWVTTAPDKYEKIGGETKDYDPLIFPLYAGYAEGADNTEVYEGGETTIWKQLLPKIIVFGLFAAGGIGFLLWFFLGGGASGMVSEGNQAIGDTKPTGVYQVPAGQMAEGGVWQPEAAPAAPAPEPEWQRKQRERDEQLAAMTPGQRYVVDLASKGRVRLAARAVTQGRELIVVEWLDSSGIPIERLTGAGLESLGIELTYTAAGVILRAGNDAIVATGWPAPVVMRETDQKLYRLDKESRDGGNAERQRAVAPVAAATGTGGESWSTAAYGDMGVSTGSYKNEGVRMGR